MFNWFRRKAQKVIPAAVLPEGFFSTHSDLHRQGTIQRAYDSYKKSFQRGPEDFKMVNADGTAMDSATMQVAMDDFGLTGLQRVKLLQAGVTGNINPVQFDWYAAQGFIGYQAAAMLSQNWLIDKCCHIPAKDAVRHGYEVTVNDGTEVSPNVLEEIARMDKKFNIKNNCIEFIKMGRVFGIRIAMFKVDSPDPDYYSKPFNPDGITPGSYKGISQIDPYWITPELDSAAAADPSSIHFYEPTWWRVNAKRVHRSHLIIFRNGDVPDILKPTYLYGGIPVPQKVMERIYAAERTANEAPLLALTKRTQIIHVDVAAALANLQKFEAKMQAAQYYQNNFGKTILGKEETAEQFDTALSDLDAVIMTQYQIVAAAAGIPATKLLGTSPKGFNATGEFESDSYHEELESIQEIDLTPLIDRHHLLLMRSYIAPKFSMKPVSTSINWHPVDSPSAKEVAEINKVKADTDSALVAAGAIDAYDVRQRLIADNDSGYNGIEDIVPGGPGDRDAEKEQTDNEERRTEEQHQANMQSQNEGGNTTE